MEELLEFLKKKGDFKVRLFYEDSPLLKKLRVY